jgi:RNA polymerase sigma factor (TIGR02999 family)
MFDLGVAHQGNESLDRVDAALIEEVYSELKRVAAWHLSAMHQDITLGPTDLTHEAIGRVLRQKKDDWNNETHLLAVASLMVRRVLLSHLRSRSAQKRGGMEVAHRVLFEPAGREGLSPIDLLCLCEAIDGLEQRQSTIVQMKVFGGMKTEMIAEFLGVSVRTVQLEWNHARLWLARELAR